jgi:Cu2+-exporting ATPase
MLGFPGVPLWEELSTLVTIMLLGDWIQTRSIMQAQGALKELTKPFPDRAVRIVEDRTEEVAVSDLDYSSKATSLTRATPSLRFS